MGYHKGVTIMKPNWENHMARSCGYDGDTGISPKIWF